MTAEQRVIFDRDGYLIIRGALRPDEAADARDAIDRAYASVAKAGSLGPDGTMHLLSAVTNCPEVAGYQGDRRARRRGVLRPPDLAHPVT
jgi:hypothetical protein